MSSPRHANWPRGQSTVDGADHDVDSIESPVVCGTVWWTASARVLKRAYSGGFPCFLNGRLWRLWRSISRAAMSLGRVSCGSITSSR